MEVNSIVRCACAVSEGQWYSLGCLAHSRWPLSLWGCWAPRKWSLTETIYQDSFTVARDRKCNSNWLKNLLVHITEKFRSRSWLQVWCDPGQQGYYLNPVFVLLALPSWWQDGRYHLLAPSSHPSLKRAAPGPDSDPDWTDLCHVLPLLNQSQWPGQLSSPMGQPGSYLHL